MTRTPDRRHFLSRLATLGASVGASVGLLSPRLGHALPTPNAPREDPWIARLTGTHRVIFHSHLPTEGQAIRWGQTFLDTQKASYGLRDGDSSVVIGLNGRSIGWFFDDALWAKYPTIGEVMGSPGPVNPQASAVAALAARGSILLVCNNSLRASGQRFLPEPSRSDATARTAFGEEARSRLLPHVEIVPAMIVTLQQAQDRGCRYIYAGG